MQLFISRKKNTLLCAVRCKNYPRISAYKKAIEA